MLVLTRNISKSIRIGDDITITVLSINDNQVRLGINAPRAISVHRGEIYTKILAERNTDQEKEDEEGDQ